MYLNAKTRAASLAATCAIAMLGLTVTAEAAGVVGPDVIVRFGDLPLSDAANANRVLARIQSAATEVCAPLDHGNLASRRNRDSCRSKLVDAAVRKIDQPLLYSAWGHRDAAAVGIAALPQSPVERR